MSIAREDMSTLIAASQALAIAESAEQDAQVASIAYSINNAANTGETSVVWIGNMLDDVKTQLEDEGYTVERTKLHTGEPVTYSYTISFDSAE